jgi:hypothetical protein
VLGPNSGAADSDTAFSIPGRTCADVGEWANPMMVTRIGKTAGSENRRKAIM